MSVLSDLLGVMLGGCYPRLYLLLFVFDFFLYVLFVEWLVSCGHVWFLLVVCGVCVVDVCVVDVCVVDCYVVVVSVETFVSLGYSLVFLYVVVLALLGSVMSFVFGSLLS